MNRSNSFVSALKWWPLQGHTQSTTNGSNQHQQQHQQQQFHHFSNGNCNNNHILHHNKTVSFGSSVAVQKLRESKWFKSEEQKIFCAVVECGFIVEVRNSSNSNSNRSDYPYNHIDDDDDEDDETTRRLNACAGHNGLQDENETPVISWFGVVLCKTTKDNKPKPETIEIFSVKIRENGTFKMIKMSLENIWALNYELRINNFADKEKQPHNEKDIKNQVSFARKAKQSLWNNSKHFAYWCRYGSRQQDVRKRQMSECVKWGSVGMNAGMLLVMSKQKSYTK